MPATDTFPPTKTESVEDEGACGSGGAAGNSKRGFVYVQQPHYSVFDVPPADLGKRRRRVHNYSMLAKGPSLKGKDVLLGEGDEIDGESAATSRPTSPASPAPPTTNSQSPMNSGDGEKHAASGSSSGFARRRRFLTSPLKPSDKTVIFSSSKVSKPEEVSTTSSNNGSDSRSIFKKSESNSRQSVASSLPVASAAEPTNCRDSSSNSVSIINDGEDVSKTPKNSRTSFKSNAASNSRTTNTNNVTASSDHTSSSSSLSKIDSSLTIPSSSESTTEEVPAKRLRRPTFKRFSEEEGYVDILSSRRNRRELSRRSIPANNAKTPKSSHKSSTRSSLPSKSQHVALPPTPPPLIEASPLYEETTSLSPLSAKEDLTRLPKLKKSNSFAAVSIQLPVSSHSKTRPVSSSSSSRRRTNNHSVSYNDDKESDEEEELLDVDEYTDIPRELPKPSHRKGPKVPVKSPSKSISANHKSPTTHQYHREKDVTVLHEEIGGKDSPLSNKVDGTAEDSIVTNSRELRRRKCANRRWTITSESALETTKSSLPSVVLDRLPISHVQIRVRKCDSNIAPISIDQKSPLVDINDQSPSSRGSASSDLLDKDVETIELEDEDPLSTANWKQPRRKRWGENKHRWTKPRNKPGLLSGMRQGIRINESLSMQLLKRSKIQRRYEKRGRPKVALLTGITKKKLKRIQDSVLKRKLTKKPIIAYTKFKDVRVDIINCICGRTDEFGLMVQCEVCLCWQHGVCFEIIDGSMIPRFYVCQSCKSPKNVRPRSLNEGIRQEIYKKGILPRFSFAHQPSEKDQKLVHSTYELCKLIDSVEDIIRQNRIKEQIVLSEPENPRLYQWSTPRESPKDRVQKWYFNKYFLSVLRRLLLRNRKQPEYVDTLKNIVLFREKLKTYTQAFEEAKSAITRKIGSRGLILVEKLSEHQKKLDKIVKLKAESADENLKETPEETKADDHGQMLELLPPPPPKTDHEVKTSDTVASIAGSTSAGTTHEKSKVTATWKVRLEKMIDCIEEMYREWDSSSENDEKSDDKDECEVIGTVLKPADDQPLPSDSPLIQDWKEVFDSMRKVKSPIDHAQAAVPSAATKLKDTSQRKRQRNVKQEVLEPTRKKTSVSATPDYVQVRSHDNKSSSKVKPHDEEDPGSGASTISGVDSQGGEDYWYNPIRDLNPEYESMKRFLLSDPLTEDDRTGDPTWHPRLEDISEEDWKYDIDSILGLDESSESSELEETDSESADADDGMDTSNITEGEQQAEVTGEQQMRESEVVQVNGDDWRNKLLPPKEKENNIEDDVDPDWKGVFKSSVESISGAPDIPSASNYQSSCSINGIKPRKLVGHPSGVVLVTSDPEAKLGDQVTVSVIVGGTEETLGSGIIVGGNKGHNFVRLLSKNNGSKADTVELNNFTDAPTSQSVPLCRSCRESLGNKWTWNQLHTAKGLELVCEDTLRSFVEELKLYEELGLSWSTLNVQVQLPTKSRNSPYYRQYANSFSYHGSSPYNKYEDYRRKITENTPVGSHSGLLPDFSSQFLSSQPLQPASAEEESVLSLLSLSKTPVQFNGENVSELSIESLRKLTDRLQQNGPLTEDLAKAVGEPLVNGKIGLQNAHTYPPTSAALSSSVPSLPDICLRCSLRGKTRKTLTILSTLDASLAQNMSEVEIVRLYNRIKDIVTDTRAVLHVIKKAVLNRIWLTVEQVDAERSALASGKSISPSAIQKKLALRRPEKHLLQQKTEYVDALLPYATYFISRFTKRDELNNAKRNWVEEMVKNYIKSKRSLKKMFDAANEDVRVAKEGKFYTALDNLRKSFDIVLTKKDIKLRRQNQVSLSSMGSPLPSGVPVSNNPAADDVIPEDTTKQCSSSFIEVEENSSNTLEDGLQTKENSASVSLAEQSTSTAINNTMDIDSVVPPPVSTGEVKESNGPLETPSETELEIIARLTQYPIQMEDVNALLRITSEGKLDLDLKADGCIPLLDTSKLGECVKPLTDSNGSDTRKMDSTDIEPSTCSNTNGTEAMEVDDIKLLEENLSLKTAGNLDIGGDFDLINTIGTLGSSVDLKEQEDSDLLLNVFDDPVFSEPQEPTPCCSKSLAQQQPNQPSTNSGPVLAKLTPEICKGYLLDDIKAHQLVIDTQLERVEAEIMELERRHGAGLREKDDSSLFEMLYANMQVLMHNYNVLSKIVERQVGENDPEEAEEGDENDIISQNDMQSEEEAVNESESETESSSESDDEELLDIPY